MLYSVESYNMLSECIFWRSLL